MAADPKFPRGAIATPRHVLAGATPHVPLAVVPSQWIVLPKKLSFWKNDQFGVCVSSSEAFAKAAFSVANGLSETFIEDATVLAFATKFGFLNGASLTDVMDKMISDGFEQNGQTFKNGPYNSVDYNNETILQSAVTIGTVKIGIDANALPSEAGNSPVWSVFGGKLGEFANEDHCISITGYGPVTAICAALNIAVPSGAPSDGYVVETWNSFGIVDHKWVMSCCGEAWVRNPTTVGIVPNPGPLPNPIPPSPPVPGPSPSPNPNYSGKFVGSMKFGHQSYPITGDISLTPQAANSLAINWAALFAAGLALFMAVLSKNVPGILAAIQQVLAAFGIALTEEQKVRVIQSLGTNSTR